MTDKSIDPNDSAALEAIGATYTTGSSQDRTIRELIARTFAPFLNEAMRGLQLGYAEGIDTRLLAPLVAHLDVVEGNRRFFEAGQQCGIRNATFHHALFETFLAAQDSAGYDAIFLVYVLEHVQDPVALLRMALKTAAPSGHLFIVVPNERALSRQLALHMGLLPALNALTQHDLAHGHLRAYNRVSLNRDIESASLRVIAQGGIMLKILADFQLDMLMDQNILGPSQIEGLYQLGFEYPDLCGSLFAICDNPERICPS